MTSIRSVSNKLSDEELLHTALTDTLRRNGASPESAIARWAKCRGKDW